MSDKESLYLVTHWRNNQQTADIFDNFLFWLEYDSPEDNQEELDRITVLVNEFLGRDMNKIRQGEQEMLDRWIKANEKLNNPNP